MITPRITDDAVIRFATERPEVLDLLPERRRRIFVALVSECTDQRRSTKDLAAEEGVTTSRINELKRDAIRIIRRFMRDDDRKCPHCDGRGWV